MLVEETAKLDRPAELGSRFQKGAIFRASDATYGEPSTRTVTLSTSSYKNARILRPLSASFESCFVLKRKYQ